MKHLKLLAAVRKYVGENIEKDFDHILNQVEQMAIKLGVELTLPQKVAR